MAKGYIRTEYNGVVVLSNIRKGKASIPVIGMNDSYTATKVTTWWDGSPMTSEKVDGSVYLQLKETSEYFRVNLPNWGETFLQKPNVASLRNMSSTEILLLRMGYYKGVNLLGYYAENGGDTPSPIEYLLSTTTEEDDGGSVFEVGGIKLEHDFNNGADVLYYGAIPNADATVQLNNISNHQNKIFVTKPYKVNPANSPSPDYSYDGGWMLQSNSEVIFSGEGKIYIDSQSVNRYAIINITGKTNITLTNAFVEGDIDSHVGTTGEWGHGVLIYSSENIVVNGGVMRKCWGDGIVIASDKLLQTPCIGGSINNVLCDDNRRQGMSIMSWVRGVVNGGVFKDTGKTSLTPPAFGIDIEPNPQGYDAIDVVLNNVNTEGNVRGGIQFTPGFLTNPLYDTNPYGRLYNVVVNNHSSVNDGILGGVRFANPELTDINLDLTKRIRGGIIVNNSTIRDSQRTSIRIDRRPKLGLGIYFNNTTIVNPSSVRHSSPLVNNSGVYITSDNAGQTNSGIIDFDRITISDNRPSILMEQPIVYQGLASGITGFSVSGLKVSSGYVGSFGDVYMINNNTGVISYKNEVIESLTESTSISDGSKYNSKIINVTQPSTITLPLNNAQNTIIEIRYRATSGNIVLNPNTGQSIDFFGRSSSEGVILRTTRDSIRLQLRGSTWQVLRYTGAVHLSGRTSSDINRSYISNNTPPTSAPKWYGEDYYDSASKTWYKASGINSTSDFIPLNGIKQLAASPDTATQAAGETPTKAEFDALLAELRDLKTKMRAGSAPLLSS